MNRPPLIFLDEPTTGLDPQNRANLWDEVRGLRDRGTSVLLTTHYLDEADALCDRLVIVDHGLIVAEGTPRELKKEVAGDVVTLRIDDQAAAQELLAAQPYIKETQTEGDTLRAYLDDGEHNLPTLLRPWRPAAWPSGPSPSTGPRSTTSSCGTPAAPSATPPDLLAARPPLGTPHASEQPTPNRYAGGRCAGGPPPPWARSTNRAIGRQGTRETRMAQTTIEQFATELKIPAGALLEQLGKAGVAGKKEGDKLSEVDKTKLLEYLQKQHGAAGEPKKKITLTRKQTTEIKAAGSMGKARTIQVEVRKKRVFVKRDEQETAPPVEEAAPAPVAAAPLITPRARGSRGARKRRDRS